MPFWLVVLFTLMGSIVTVFTSIVTHSTHIVTEYAIRASFWLFSRFGVVFPFLYGNNFVSVELFLVDCL